MLVLLCLVAVILPVTAVRAAPPSATLEEMLVSADRLRDGGDYPAAIAAYQKVLDAAGNAPVDGDLAAARTALYRIAQTYSNDQNPAQAAETWSKFLTTYPDDQRRPLAFLQQANALRASNNLTNALAAYQAYRTATTPTDPLLPYVALQLAQGYRDAGLNAQAVSEYRAVLAAPDILNSTRVLTGQRLGDALAKAGDNEAAVAAYDEALKYAQTANTRSELDVAAAKALKELGRTDDAVLRYKRVLNDTVEGDAAADAVEPLLALAPKELNFYQAGLAYYFKRQYVPAINWLHRYLDEQNDLDLAHYYAAKAYEFNGQQDKAIREWTSLITTHETSGKLLEAMYERADDYHRIAQDPTAIKLYRQVAASYPSSPWAESSLYAVGKIYEAAGQKQDAVKQYETTQTAYPAGAHAAEELATAGLLRYGLGDMKGAQATLTKLLTGYGNSSWKAKGLYWLAKVLQKQGLANDARLRLQQTAQAQPDDYYALRAQDMLSGTIPLGNERAKYTLPASQPDEERDMEAWLREWAPLTDSDDSGNHRQYRLSPLPAEISSDPRMRSGQMLMEVGMRSEARAELRSLADQYKNDPVVQYQLGRLWQQMGLYDMVILAGSRIMALAPVNSISEAPIFLQKMMYPAPFSDLVIANAHKYKFDPLLLFGILYQESQFDPAAISSVGAIGLGQVMPGTGSDIAARLKRANYKQSDLLKPYVSIEFGAYYFGFQYDYFDQDYLMALAGYNSGPGNAAKWSNPDVDVAVENIAFAETRTYVRRIYLHYWHYRNIYGDQLPSN